MPDWLDYKGIEVPDATPTGDAGLKLKQDLQSLVDWSPKSKWDATVDPDQDNDDSEDYYPGSLWLNTSSDKLFVCLDNSTGSAVWQSVLTKVQDDPAPELGGELDAGAHTIGFSQQAISSSSNAATIDWRNSNKAAITLTEDVTFTFTAPSNPCNILLKVTQDGTGGWEITWPASVKWPGGSEPTISAGASAIDIISFYFDGTNYFGAASQNFS